MSARRAGAWCLVIAVALLIDSPAASAAENAERLDDGRLDPSWFGRDVAFRAAHDFDYVWVKPGFTAKGKKLRVEPWPDPLFEGKERKARDAAMAFELAEHMPSRIRTVLRHSLRGVAEVVTEGGDLILSGRLVDFVAKGTMRASNPQATWDMKITDAATGELLVAVHHRKLMSISTVEERIVAWLEKFGEALKEGLPTAASGEP